jgi:nucleoside phosphorylase
VRFVADRPDHHPEQEVPIDNGQIATMAVSRRNVARLSEALDGEKDDGLRLNAAWSLLHTDSSIESSLSWAKKHGAVEVVPERSIARFAVGLNRIAHYDHVANLYMFVCPLRFGPRSPELTPIGFLVCSSNPLNERDIEYCKTLSDVLFVSYLHDLHLEGWSNKRNTAVAAIESKRRLGALNKIPARSVVVLTATPAEKQACTELAREFGFHPETLTQTPYLTAWRHGSVELYHIHTDTSGSLSEGASLSTLKHALETTEKSGKPRPCFAATVGICYSLNEGGGSVVGDILVSNEFQTKYAMEGTLVKDKGAPISVPQDLWTPFAKAAQRWAVGQEKVRRSGKARSISVWEGHPIPRITLGQIFSCDVLWRADEGVRDSVKSSYPQAIGGEMEAIGMVAEMKGRVIAVKSIVDWGSIGKEKSYRLRQERISFLL